MRIVTRTSKYKGCLYCTNCKEHEIYRIETSTSTIPVVHCSTLLVAVTKRFSKVTQKPRSFINHHHHAPLKVSEHSSQ